MNPHLMPHVSTSPHVFLSITYSSDTSHPTPSLSIYIYIYLLILYYFQLRITSSFSTLKLPSLSLLFFFFFSISLSKMAKRSKPLLVLCTLVLLIMFLVGPTNGSSRSKHTQFLKVKPKTTHNSHHGSFYGFLPKAMPIPPSGPSKRHNDIGFKSSQPLP